MSFLKNTWYAIGWGEDIGDALVMRRVIDEPIVLYRNDGVLHALSDTCPHRFAPMHLGKRAGDGIQCLYHGLRFGADGACVHNPHSDTIPRNARLRVYPIVERHKLAWVWMGEAALADAALIPDFAFIEDAEYAVIKGTIEGRGNYEYYTDNILDLSHADYLHTGLAAPAFTIGKRTIQDDGRTLRSSIYHPNDLPSEIVQFVSRRQGQVSDFWGETRWEPPAAMAFDLYLADVGQAKPSKPNIPTMHVFTPETASTTRYYWAAGRNVAIDDEAFSAQLMAGTLHAFICEDKMMIEAQADRISGHDFWSLNPILLPSDAGAVRARRLLGRMIAEQMTTMTEGKVAAAAD